VIRHLDGNCHVFVDKAADIDKAVAVAYNAKCRRYGICGAMETLLVSEKIAAPVLEQLGPMYEAAGVEIRGCARTRELISGAVTATEEDWYTEYLAPVLAVRIQPRRGNRAYSPVRVGTYRCDHYRRSFGQPPVFT